MDINRQRGGDRDKTLHQPETPKSTVTSLPLSLPGTSASAKDCLLALDFGTTAQEQETVQVQLQIPVVLNLAACMLTTKAYERYDIEMLPTDEPAGFLAIQQISKPEKGRRMCLVVRVPVQVQGAVQCGSRARPEFAQGPVQTVRARSHLVPVYYRVLVRQESASWNLQSPRGRHSEAWASLNLSLGLAQQDLCSPRSRFLPAGVRILPVCLSFSLYAYL